MKLRISIYYKITLIIAVIAAIAYTGLYIFLIKDLKRHTLENIRTTLFQELKLTKSYLEDKSTRTRITDGLDQLTDRIGRELALRVSVIDSEGRLLADSQLKQTEFSNDENHLFEPEIQAAMKNGVGESQRFSTTLQKDMLFMAIPFERGFVRLAIPVSQIQIMTDSLKATWKLRLNAAFVLTVLVSSLAASFVLKPIREMALVAKSIIRGDYSRKMPQSTTEEFADIGRVINDMLEQIQEGREETVSSQSRYETILLSMFEGVMVIDGQGTIILMNSTLKKFFGVTGDPLGKKPLEVIRNIEIQEIVDKILKRKKGVESRDLSIMLPVEKMLQIHATPVLLNNQVDGAVLVFHDITALRRLENIRQDFVANVSHELRTPITNIKGYAETLLEGALNDKEHAKEFLNVIHQDSQRLAQLVNDLLDLSTIESGKLKLNIQSVKMKTIVERVLLGFKKQIRDKKLTVKNTIDSKCPAVKADGKGITQVLLNLIDNAVKYNKEGGEIIISANADGSYLKVDITDTGIGIPQDDLPRLFERFYRVDKARSRELGGTGLGLSIAKHIIQAHGGQVSVSSQPQKGSTFTFTLPIE